MANKTQTLDSTVKHQMLDIEIEIDEEIASRIATVKADYINAIADYKVRRADAIKEIRAERKVLLREAYNNLVEA